MVCLDAGLSRWPSWPRSGANRIREICSGPGGGGFPALPLPPKCNKRPHRVDWDQCFGKVLIVPLGSTSSSNLAVSVLIGYGWNRGQDKFNLLLQERPSASRRQKLSPHKVQAFNSLGCLFLEHAPRVSTRV